MKTNFSIRHGFEWMVVCGLLVLSTGCRKQGDPKRGAVRAIVRAATNPPQPPNDQQILGEIQSKIQGEPALRGQRIDVDVAGGVATLSGNVDNDASRALAAADSGAVDGVRTVINNLEVMPAQSGRTGKAAPKAPKPERKLAAKAVPPPPPAAALPRPRPRRLRPQQRPFKSLPHHLHRRLRLLRRQRQ